MDYLYTFIDIVLHLDKHLDSLVLAYGVWTYAILTLIVFMETGVVVTPFLPGDSLLFAAGAIAARGTMNVYILGAALLLAAILGNTTNYFIGRYFGDRVSSSKWIKKEYLDRTHEFYEKYGGKTLIITRFVPIIRTFAPFVAGVGKMSYAKFNVFNIAGGVLWVVSLVGAGYLFGDIPFVKNNFSLVVIAIIVVSFIPAVIEIIKIRALSKPR